MTEKPLIFSTPMVRALLDGSKSMTRRLVNPQPFHGEIEDGILIDEGKVYSPPHPVGSKIWVREVWCVKMDDGTFVYRPDGEHDLWYRADCPHDVTKDDGDGGTAYRKDGSEASPWQSPIFMPKKFARIWLEVTAVKVEKLGDISEDDAKKEGIFHTDYGMWCFHRNEIYDPNKCKAPRQHHNQLEGWHWDKTISYTQCLGSPVSAYVNLWTSLHGPGSWDRDKDKWCWCYEFRKL